MNTNELKFNGYKENLLPQKVQSLPIKIEAYEVNLLQAKDEIKNFIRLSEGLVFKKVGLDALLGIIPVVGGIYTGVAGIWLLFQSNRVKTGFQEKLLILILTLADIVIGVLVAAGDILDAFFRVHAWTGNRLIAHINMQLSLIERTREQLNQGLDVDLDALEDILFRNGSTKRQKTTRNLILALILMVVFVSCTLMAG
ncbi:MAG: DUF4112 domain-containing protein [Symploca sp. SIO1C2]|nr:DUF4112 domain-containing protein [Symploca sp. SIO1C2]